MDVRLPNGMLIRGIPEGTTQEQIADRLSSAGYDLAELGIQQRPQQIEEPTPEPVEDQSIFRSVADVPLQFATGVSQGVRFISDAFGADNAVSQNLRGVEDYLGSLLSAQAKNDREEVARIFQDAQDKGLGERLAAGLRALAVSPVDFIAQGLGTAVPTIAGGLAGAALRGGTLAARAATAAKVGTGIGVVGGAGLTKSTIYDEVKNELEALDLPEEVVEERARLAQEYGGENLDQILLGAGLGGLAAGTGIEKVLASRILKNAGARTTGALAATKAAAFTGAKEAVPEFIQAAQEQMAGNIALQREGFEDIPTMRGVAEAAALEGSVGFLIGAGIGGIDAAVSPQQRSRYDAARASITNEVDRERELALRLEADQAAQRFMDSLAADNARRAQGQADQVNLDAEAANARAAASNIAPPTQDEVNALATPFKGADVSGDVQFGISYGQKIARELGDYFPNFGQFSVRQGEVQGDGTYGPEGRAISLGTPTFEVIDSEGKRYGQPLQTFEQANATALSLNKEVINQNVRGAIRNSLDISPQPYDPETTQRLFTYGYRTLNPEANTFSTVAINEAAKTTGPEYAEGLSWRQVEALPQAKDRRGRVIGYEFRPEGAAEGQPPRIIKGLTKAQEINKARSQEGKPESSVFSLQETKSALGKSFAAITKDVPIDPAIGKQGAINQIRDLIRSKNITSDIASPEINALAKNLTGKDSVQDMDYGDIRLFYKKLAPLPRFERETQLPVFEFKPYSRENFVRASKFIQTANAQGQKPTRDQIIEAAGLSKEDPKIDEKISTLQTDLSKQGVKNTPQKPVTPAREPLALPAPPGQAIDLQSLRDALRAKLKGFGLNDIQLSLERNLITPTGEIMGPESEGFFLPAMRQIFLAVDRVDPDGSLTPEQRLNALAEILDHEVIHAARLLDLWTESEWSTLEKAASRTLKPGTNQTYLQIAQQNYPDQNPVVQMEEAIAEMFRDYSAKRLKISGKPQNLLQRLAQFFERLKSALAGTGFQTYSDVFNRLQTGALGGRQRGEVRTLRATEESVAQTGRIPERLRDILRTPQGRTQYRTDAIRNMISRLSPQASPPAANFARVEAIRESRRATDPVPATIRVGDQEFPTTDSQGRLIYSGYEGPEVFGVQTAPTNQGLSNFWNRFKNSKIKDSQGRPLVYYHGTAQDITAFRPKQAGSVFVTLSPTFAEEFAFLSDSYMVGNFTDFMPDQEVLNVLNETLQSPSAFSPKVYDRVVKLRDSVANSVENNRAIRASTVKELKEIASQGRSSRFLNAIQTRMPSSANVMPVYVNAEKPWDYQNREDVRAVVRRARDNGADVTPSMVEEINQGNWQTIEGSEGNAPILDAIRELGYDAMYVEEAGQKNLAVFNPNQVKSAIGNNGDFGPTLSIRESRRVRNPQIDTPEFQRFFRDSKIVDENGEPLVVYHGTGADIETFKASRLGGALGTGIYFTPSPEFAGEYATREGGNIVPVYVSIKKPLIIDGSISIDPMIEALVRLGESESKASRIVEKAYETKGYITTEVRSRAQNQGFDGIVQTRNGQIGEIVAFNPNQVKSAVGNVGTFKIYSPSIRESRVRNPQIDTPEFQQAFRGSKAVDEAGEPQIFYHGATRDIDVFRPKPGKKLIFTSPDPNFASRYAANNLLFFLPSPEWGPQDVDWAERQIANAQFGDRTRAPTVYPLYVIAKNPFDFENKSHIAQLEKDLPKFLSKSTPSRGPYTRAEIKKTIDEIKKGRWGYIEDVAENTDFFEKSGYDSLYVEEAGVRNLAVFSPNQLKSAVGNVGAFDITRPSIRESRRRPQQILFEVAPDPNNEPLTEAWRNLDADVRLNISERVARDIVPRVLTASNARGSVVSQVGSYLDDTNPSFALMLERGDPLDIAKSIGFALSQDSMMVVSPRSFRGGDIVQSVTVEVGDRTPQEIADIYNSLREIEVDGSKPVGGQTFANGSMTILNYSDVPTSTLADLIDNKLNNEYDVLVTDIYSAFPEKKDYDYASPTDDGTGERADLRKRLRDIRAEATDAVQREIQGLRAEGRTAAPEAAALTTPRREARRVPRSTVSIFEMPTEQARLELGLAPGRNLTRLVGERLNERTQNEFGKISDKDTSDQASRQIADAMVSEVLLQLQTTAETGTGIGWYSNNYPRALARLAKRFPELATDPNARSLFTAIVAITSNGEDVNQNISNAISIYTEARTGRRLSELAVGTRRSDSLQNNLEVLEELIDIHGMEGFAPALLKEMSVKDINAELRRLGKKPESNYTAETIMPRSALYFGPKLGAFYANLMGSEGYLTMDLWWSRMFNRMRGTLVPKPTPSSIKRVREMLVSIGVLPPSWVQGIVQPTDEDVIDAAVPFWESAKEKEYKNMTELETAANTLIKAARLELEEAPFRASDRSFMIKTTRLAQDILRDQGIDLSLADIQAALWYYEKRLYAKLTGRERDAIGYEEAILRESESARPERSPARFYRGRTSRIVPEREGEADRRIVSTEEPVIRAARRAPPPVTAAPQQPGPAVDTDTTGAAEALNEGQPVNSMGVAIGPVIGDTEPDGTVDISRARIAPITRRLVSQLIQSAPDKLRAGFGLDDLANRIENYYDGYAAKLGIVNNLIRNAYRNIRLGGRDAAMETFERYMRARENKKPNEAMAILNNASESERQLIDAWTQISNETGNINKNVRTPDGEPMKVYDAKLNDGKGGWRPIGTVAAFFPRTLRREVMEVMKNPDLDPELWQSLLDSLVQSGREDIKNPADAEKYLLREWFSDEIKNDYFAGVEKARTEPLPEIFYDYSWDAATRYLNKWARRTSQIENFGQELGQFKKEWFGANLPKIRDQETQNYVNTIRERIYEIEPFDTLSNMANWLNSLATATQLGNPISASLNLFGGTIANIQEFGIRAVAKSYLDLLTDWRRIQEEGTSLGILNKDFMNILRDHVEMDADKYFSKEQRISQSLARFANTALTFGGFNAAENVVRSSAMLAARARLNTFLKKVNDSPDSANVKKFNAWAKRENLNVEALILENGSGRETEKYMRRAVNIPQGSYQIDMTPVFIDTTAGRFFFKYQKFGTQINRFFYNHFLKPILTEEGRRGRNILRALGFVGTAIVGGGAILAIREAFGYGDPGPDLDELDEALKNEDTARAWALILSRSMENIMAAGSFGFFANYAQFAKDWQDQQRVKNPMSPPGLASVDAVIDVFNRLRDQKTITARDLDEIAETTMSFYRANKRIGLAVMDEMGSDAKEVERFAAFRDLREVREYGRRFSDEMGIEFKRSTAPGSPIRTEMTPVNKAITDALHVGDAAAARIIMREAIMGVPPKERQRIRQSIQSSIRNRQPLQIGGNAPSKEERILFMRWAKQNLPKEKVDLILRADREYRRAAARIGMGIS